MLEKVATDRRDIAEYFADHAANTRFEDLPDEAVSAAKVFLLDTIGAAIAGWQAPGCQEVHDLVAEWGGREESTVWVRGTRVPAPNAALANGLLCHALEFDDLHDQAHVHCFAPVLPAALAIAERADAVSGREFLTALILGVDVMARLGLAIEVERGWHYTLTFGYFGAAVAAARLLGLDRAGQLNVIGIAFSHAGGTEQCVVEARLIKRVHPGLAAQAGITAALLAARGITGPAQAFEGKLGYYNTHENGIYLRDRVLDGLGKRFEVAALRIKPYPACGYTHASLDALFEIVRKANLKAEEVSEVEVAGSQVMHDLVGRPFEVRANPQADAQFSISYQFAAALRRGRVSLAEFQHDAIFDPQTQDLAKRVHVVVDTSIAPRAPAPAMVQVKTHDGRILRARANDTRGHPGNPLPQSEIELKFRRCIEFAELPEFSARADALIDVIQRIETIPDIRALATLLTPKGT